MTLPRLDQMVTVHQCCCILWVRHSDGVEIRRHRLRCNQQVAGSDNPFCATCEGRHPDISDRSTVDAQLPGALHEPA